MKKVILIGAEGTLGKQITSLLKNEVEFITVGRKSGQYQADMEDPASLKALYQKIGSFDAVMNASGSLSFAPATQLTTEQWMTGLKSKLLGQVNLVKEAIPFIADGGSFTLVSGVIADHPIAGGAAATAINRAIEGYAFAAACELPRSLRINVVSPNMLEESAAKYGSLFPGVTPVPGRDVALAYKKSLFGIQTGQVFKVF